MYKVEKEFLFIPKSNCKVGKITSSKNGADDSRIIQIDFKTEAFKKSNMAFTEKRRAL
ncbi:MAG TPA: hypothetical protein VFS71_06775 [Flavobacterium sp.]|uniref:hypothetical protein n=1 Tax=Flavobacterium sp. TaxID=239 RepID=UPI002DBE529A|nr:hypothetical protein [Flavobacterium sp.]HEU4789370.1 hypothetical protein [Flavobacterium sp.]